MRRITTIVAALGLAVLSSEDAVPGWSRIPQTELQARIGCDDGEAIGTRAERVTYQVDATVVMPVPLVSIPLGTSDNVGVAHASVDDCRARNGRLRQYEFFATSIPRRARGLNRLGLLREVAMQGPNGVSWTAHFGVVSSTREATVEEVDERPDGDERLEAYTTLDGFSDRRRSWSETIELQLEGQWATADALYADALTQVLT